MDTLVFEVFDPDGFRSSCSGSLENGDFVANKSVRILGQYGARGTAVHESDSGEVQEDPARGMSIRIRSVANSSHPRGGKVLADTRRVYDLASYDDDKRYRS